jgi:hypothetical protein
VEQQKKGFDREMAERPMAAALEAGADWAMFGLKCMTTAQDHMLRTTRSMVDHTASVADQSRQLAEEMVNVNKKLARELQQSWLHIWSNAADTYKLPEIKSAAGDKKTA